MRLQSTSGAGFEGRNVIQKANCDPGDLVGDAVYVSADKVAGIITVTKVDIDSSTYIEAVTVGVIISKSDPSTCNVRLSGVVESLYSGLTPGSRLYVDDNSRLIEGPPVRPSTGKRIIQEVAYALSKDTILVRPLSPFRVRAV